MSKQHMTAHRVHPGPVPQAAHPGQVRRRQQARRRIWRGPVLLSLVLSVVALAAVFALRAGASAGTLSADRTQYDFGQIRLNGGLVTTRFPLTVAGTVRVVGLDTTWACTKGRLVQADHVSDWFGMTHDGTALTPDVTLVAGTPAYLEVSIDPAAHGEAGLGPLTRGVRITTATKQTLEFVLTGQIIR